MVFELLLQYLLMLLVNIGDQLCLLSLFLESGHITPINLICVQEPNATIVIFRKLAPHFQYLNLMHFLDIVTHFKALLQTEASVIAAHDQLDVLAALSKVVLDCFVHLSFLHGRGWGVKMNHYRLTDAGATFDGSLYEPESVNLLRVTQVGIQLLIFVKHLNVVDHVLLNLLLASLVTLPKSKR
jgi:hypothetical protein